MPDGVGNKGIEKEEATPDMYYDEDMIDFFSRDQYNHPLEADYILRHWNLFWGERTVCNKTVPLIVLIFSLAGVFLFSLSGCNRSIGGSDNQVSPSTKPALPLLDTVIHKSIETAYFAMG